MSGTEQLSSNTFGKLVDTVEVCLVTPGANGEGGSLGQIAAYLSDVVGKFRPMV